MRTRKIFGLLLVVLCIVAFSVACAKEDDGLNVGPAVIISDISSGAEITLTNDCNIPASDVEFDILKDGKVVTSVKTDSNGKATAKLQPGDYIYLMKSVPDGFMLDNIEYQFTVSEGITNISHMVYSVETGGICLRSLDESGNVVPNVKFSICKDGKVIETLETDSTGEAMATLQAGDYVYVMTSAPEGTDVDDTEYQFTISKNIVEVDVVVDKS